MLYFVVYLRASNAMPTRPSNSAICTQHTTTDTGQKTASCLQLSLCLYTYITDQLNLNGNTSWLKYYMMQEWVVKAADLVVRSDVDLRDLHKHLHTHTFTVHAGV